VVSQGIQEGGSRLDAHDAFLPVYQEREVNEPPLYFGLAVVHAIVGIRVGNVFAGHHGRNCGGGSHGAHSRKKLSAAKLMFRHFRRSSIGHCYAVVIPL
jgi:hypothetical protein